MICIKELCLVTYIKVKRLQWISHALRTNIDCIIRNTLKATFTGQEQVKSQNYTERHGKKRCCQHAVLSDLKVDRNVKNV